MADSVDQNWNVEVSKILPYIDGRGLDIGCGRRSINKDIKRVDIDPLKEPDILAPGDKIPVKDNEFDFVVSQHSFEHFVDQDKTLKEWLRVIKPRGIIAIIHPDVEFTEQQKLAPSNPSLLDDPFNKHYHERTLINFVSWAKNRTKYGYKILDSGVALGKWSFYIILQKTEGGEK